LQDVAGVLLHGKYSKARWVPHVEQKLLTLSECFTGFYWFTFLCSVL